ncbi:TetR/AcrR family transcriptional regulator [Cognatishimia sp. MH4019]|uniref:TetR/AcrR family transcriptional regulator n=1 Tax=Cognatishimia sp. MH4019 TaxID=2854030 RepID=UPI001CD35423|nr:TetR/AcrR family transcriptional regulator [Cognatishimia sp. MH4019]
MADGATQIKRGRKFDQVLEGARKVFMADGYEGASVDDIAKSAEVSKATLYSYFPDKRLLFMEVARIECCRQTEHALEIIDMAQPVRDVLCNMCQHMMKFFLSPFGQRVFRICVAESDRFPELGREFYESGPGHVAASIMSYFDSAIERGELKIEDRRLAAHQLIELCKADLFPRLIFGIDTEFSDAEIDHVVTGAVDLFLARYAA